MCCTLQVERLKEALGSAQRDREDAESAYGEERIVNKELQRTVANLQRVLALSHNQQGAGETVYQHRIDTMSNEMAALSEVYPNHLVRFHVPAKILSRLLLLLSIYFIVLIDLSLVLFLIQLQSCLQS
jgi:hypothetical protein